MIGKEAEDRYLPQIQEFESGIWTDVCCRAYGPDHYVMLLNLAL